MPFLKTLTPAQFSVVLTAAASVRTKKKELDKKYGITYFDWAFVEHNAWQVVSEDGAGPLWEGLAKKLKQRIQVGIVDAQIVYVLLSEREVPEETVDKYLSMTNVLDDVERDADDADYLAELEDMAGDEAITKSMEEAFGD